MPRCVAMKENGTHCKRNAKMGSEFCGTHQGWTSVYIGSSGCCSYDDPLVDLNNQNNNRPNSSSPNIAIRIVSSFVDFMGR